MELKLIGNATNDHIYMDGELILERPGGVMNVHRALDIECELYTNKKYHEAHIQLGSKGEKYSKVDWGVDDWRGFNFPQSDWTHISYLDHVLVDLERLNTIIISADLCDTSYSPKELQFLEESLLHVDFLLIGTPELKALGGDLDVLIQKTKGTVILREKHQITCKSTATLSYPNTWISVPNTIGAGDTFVAEYLNQMVNWGDPSRCEIGIMRNCVKKTVAYLRELNEI